MTAKKMIVGRRRRRCIKRKLYSSKSSSSEWVAGCKLAVADVGRDHELLSDHDVHGDEVTLEGLDAAVAMVLFVAPVVLEVEQGLRLNITMTSIAW